MEAMREAWTDERLDDFRAEVNRRFDEVNRRFDRLEREVKGQRVEMNTRLAETNARLDHLSARVDHLGDRIDGLHLTVQRALLQVGGGVIVTMIVGFAGIILT